MIQDIRYSIRLWAKRPVQTLLAILALAIGIGANTGIFSVINTLLWGSLPFGNPSRLALIRPQDFIPPHDSESQFHSWRTNSNFLADAALVEDNDLNLEAASGASRAHAAQISWNFFSTLEVQPVIGRTFLPDEDTSGRNDSAVIGYGAWQRFFGGNERVLGSTIRVNGQPLTIVGVAPPGFDYPRGSVLWQPAIFRAGNNGWETVARLKEDVSWPQAHAALAVEASASAQNDVSHRPEILPLRDALAGPAKDASRLLMIAMLLVLLIACANLTNLLMARTADRNAELSIRSALGASHARIYRQVLTECLLLSVIAGAMGLGVARLLATVAFKAHPPLLALQNYPILDVRVLGFAFSLSTISSVLFGVAPAWLASRMKEFGKMASGNMRHARLIRETMVSAQVMLAVILTAASISVGAAFVALMNTDRGYDVKNVVTVNVSLEGTRQEAAESQLAYFNEVLMRLRALPGVSAASATEFLPLYATGFVGGPFGIDGGRASRNATQIPILPDYFRVMGTRLLSGRELTNEEIQSAAKVAIVNERFAREFGAPADVIGRQLTIGRGEPRKIVGVVQGMEYETDTSLANSNQVFVPSEAPGGFFSTFVVRVDGAAKNHLAAIRDTVRAVDAGVPIFGVQTMEQRLDDFFARPKFYRTAIWVFSGFALLLVVIGIYGIVSYGITQRMREIGVRLALGKNPAGLRSLLLWQSMWPIAAGAVPGIVAATFMGRLLAVVIEGTEPHDLAGASAAVLLVTIISAVSIWMGTRRIVSVDVMAVLRSE